MSAPSSRGPRRPSRASTPSFLDGSLSGAFSAVTTTARLGWRFGRVAARPLLARAQSRRAATVGPDAPAPHRATSASPQPGRHLNDHTDRPSPYRGPGLGWKGKLIVATLGLAMLRIIEGVPPEGLVGWMTTLWLLYCGGCCIAALVGGEAGDVGGVCFGLVGLTFAAVVPVWPALTGPCWWFALAGAVWFCRQPIPDRSTGSTNRLAWAQG